MRTKRPKSRLLDGIAATISAGSPALARQVPVWQVAQFSQTTSTPRTFLCDMPIGRSRRLPPLSFS
jgi:hypothetical protein